MIVTAPTSGMLRHDLSFNLIMQMNFRSIAKNSINTSRQRKKARISDALKRDIASKYGCEKGQSIPVKCFYCDTIGLIKWNGANGNVSGYVTFTGLHIDHYIPESKGGETSLGNLVLACPDCNLAKSDSLFEEWKG